MTCRPLSSKDCYSYRESRLNQQIRCETTGEGCSVIEESGTVCGETNTLSILKEFRQIYDDCLKKLEGFPDGSATLRKLAPFTKLIEDLWEQNTMLVETVEELEQEASNRVTNLQDKLNKSCQKELHNKLKAKEREVDCLTKELSEKDDLIKNYCCQIEELRKDIKGKNKKYNDILRQLRCATQKECDKSCQNNIDDDLDDCDNTKLEELFNSILKDLEDGKKTKTYHFQNAENKAKVLDRKISLLERNGSADCKQVHSTESERLAKEIAEKKSIVSEKEELQRNLDQLKLEKKELVDKVNSLQENIQELNTNFKETRWALTSEVAEKHDQVQELKRCLGVLEEQLRQADMQTHFKDDIIKELRKELKNTRKSERRGFYDVVTEIRGRKNLKNKCNSATTYVCDDSREMSQIRSEIRDSDSPGCSTSPNEVKDKNQENNNDNNESEIAKLQFQINSLKNTLKARMEQIMEQEEFTRDLEEELTQTKIALSALQEKYDKQERRSKSLAVSSLSEPGLHWRYVTLSCIIKRIEEALQSLSEKHNCGLSSCKNLIEEEMQNIISIKSDLKMLEVTKSKNQLNGCNQSNYTHLNEPQSFSEFSAKLGTRPELKIEKCSLIHVEDVEAFREKAVTGAALLEEMKEQIDILENLIGRYIEEFPCQCDKNQLESCEEKLDKLHLEFDDVTDQLCGILQKANKTFIEDSCNESLVSGDDTDKLKEDGRYQTETNPSLNTVYKLRTECQKLEKDICDQENTAEKLKNLSKQLDDELQMKRNQLAELTTELDARVCEVVKLKKLVREISHRLRQIQCGSESPEKISSSTQCMTTTDLSGLFNDLNEFMCLLEKSKHDLFEIPSRLKTDNEQLKEKLKCLEKCICNKEETLKILQDRLKLRECQIEELECKMQNSESQSCKLAQDVEEKCRLIANLQEAVRKCKQFEVHANSSRIKSLQFEVCDLDSRLKRSEKEILFKNRRMEILHNEITDLCSENLSLIEKVNIMEPRLRTVYKTCHLFEKMVNELQSELNGRECEIENLYGKIKELEEELETEFKKCEKRAAEDSKCIDELSSALKSLQSELSCSHDSYTKTIAETEDKLTKERHMYEMRECEFNQTICQLRSEIKSLQSQLQDNSISDQNSAKITDLECIIRQAESRQAIYDKKISELQKALEFTILEHEEERKNLLQKLWDEKRENMKNKTLITKLNESIKRKTINERTLKEYIDQFTEDNEVLKSEIRELKTEIEVRRKVMSVMEKEGNGDLSELEEIISDLKIQKADLKSKCCNLKIEMDKEIKLKKLLECRVEDLNIMVENKLQEFDQMVMNYKCTSSKIQQTLNKMREVEESLFCVENDIKESLNNGTVMNESECLKKLLDIKTTENAKLMSQLQILKVDMESYQIENAAVQANKDSLISRLRHEVNCFENDLQELESKYRKLCDENKRIQSELECWKEKENYNQTEFREKQKELCAKLRSTISEKNELLNSMDELQKQLEKICLENVDKEKLNRELAEECSRLKINKEANHNYLRSKSDKIIYNLTKEVKTLECELCELKGNYNNLKDEYQILLEQFKLSEKKKLNLEKLYTELSNENKNLRDLRAKFEKELNELKTQNLLLKGKITVVNQAESDGSEEKSILCGKLKELSNKIKTLEKRVIPDLENKLAEKECEIENLNMELRDANISSQRMRNEAMRVIQHTKKYLAAQRCANEMLKSRLECSNKRGNILGAENRELEEQLKAVTRMNEFLLCQLESSKNDASDTEPRSFSPLPWGCSTVERDTSSSEYLAESGFQSMQQSPTNLDFNSYDSRRSNPHWNSLRRNKYGGSVEYPSNRNSVR